MWFSQEDDNEENESSSELLKTKLDSDLDHIHKLWENKKGEGSLFGCINNSLMLSIWHVMQTSGGSSSREPIVLDYLVT